MTLSCVGVDTVAVDGSSGMCDLARERVEAKKIGFKCEVREQEYFERAFFGEEEGGTFDGCFASDALKHVPWDLMEAILSKIHRSLTAVAVAGVTSTWAAAGIGVASTSAVATGVLATGAVSSMPLTRRRARLSSSPGGTRLAITLVGRLEGVPLLLGRSRQPRHQSSPP